MKRISNDTDTYVVCCLNNYFYICFCL